MTLLPRAGEQIVGRERRERVSQLAWSGEGSFDSRRRVNSTVMWHRYLMNGLAAAQYLSYLVVGSLYFLYFGAWAGVAAGVSFVGLFLVFAPLLLGGYASALSFVMPRVAAVVALAIVIVCIVLVILGGTVSADPLLVVPTAVVIAVSIFVLLWNDRSVWARLTTKFDKIGIAILAGLPAIFATWWIAAFLFGLVSALSHRAT
jgi:hypothetical protein